jgi:hypothetical protein
MATGTNGPFIVLMIASVSALANPAVPWSAALRCAARLMVEPTPATGLITLYDQIPAGSCPRVSGCAATEVYTEHRTFVFGHQPLHWQTWVHIACHRVQAMRGGWRLGSYTGFNAEIECEAVEARARQCLD